MTSIKINSLHLMLTYQCNLECPHCFAWGSPWQDGTMRLADVQDILHQGTALGTVESIYFEGGEVSLYYATLVEAVQLAANMGFKVGIVTNGYWATSEEDACNWLEPFVGLLHDLSISNDLYHWYERLGQRVRYAKTAAEQLNIPVGYISIAQPETAHTDTAVGQLPLGETAVMYRGRAVEKLLPRAPLHPWQQFTQCPYENLRDPGRIHIDPFGYVHICQGITIGNLFQTPLTHILSQFDPDTHPITRPLLANGPVALVEQYQLPHQEQYADACHLCYQSRLALRGRFPEVLAPDQMYGVR